MIQITIEPLQGQVPSLQPNANNLRPLVPSPQVDTQQAMSEPSNTDTETTNHAPSQKPGHRATAHIKIAREVALAFTRIEPSGE